MRGIIGFGLALLIVSTVACKRTEPATVSTQAPTTETSPTTAAGNVSTTKGETWVDQVSIAIGSELATNGTIITGTGDHDFKPGEAVHLSMAVASAPPNTTVKVVWMGPNQARISEETKTITAGQQYLTFTAGDTRKWASGDYQVEIWFGDQKVSTPQFKFAS